VALDLDAVKPIPGRWFAALRIALGAFLAVRFARLIAWAPELYGGAGALPDPAASFTHGLLPNPLAVWDGPLATRGFLAALCALALLLAAGVGRRAAALALAYGSACLLDRNNLTLNPSLPYLGALLLLTACVPPGEPWRLGRRRAEPGWAFPAGVFRAAWVLMAVGYTYSGLDKLLAAPSWRDGSALRHVLELPLARPGLLRDLALALPDGALRAATWAAVAAEVAFLPLALSRRGRPVAWSALVGMHLGILALVAFAELTLGMLLVHAFTFDPAWLPRRNAGAASPAPGAGAGADDPRGAERPAEREALRCRGSRSTRVASTRLLQARRTACGSRS